MLRAFGNCVFKLNMLEKTNHTVKYPHDCLFLEEGSALIEYKPSGYSHLFQSETRFGLSDIFLISLLYYVSLTKIVQIPTLRL